MRKFWLTLTDARLRAISRVLRVSAPGLGELVENPGLAPAFFKPLRASLAAAATAPRSTPAAARALAAAEEFTARLERSFSDLALHGTAPDMATRETLLYLQRACAWAPALLSLKRRAEAAAEIRTLTAGARKNLDLARAAAESAPGDFPQNLKFSSIYSGLDVVFDAYARCAEALFSVNGNQ